MRVAIVGAHGQIGLRLARMLADRGDEVTGLIRNRGHASEVTGAGAHPVVCDVEQEDVAAITAAIGTPDAVVFAAGAGPGSGAERKLTMDRDGAIKLLSASGGARYVMVSAVGAEAPPSGDDVFEVYLRAKAEADAAVMASGGDWVIVRPGRLTNAPGAGTVALRRDPFRGEVSRDDVAAVLAAALHGPRASGLLVYLNGGSDPVDEALAALLV